jgi:hypothetical protein
LFGSSRDGVTGGYRLPHNEVIYNLQPSTNITVSKQIKADETTGGYAVYNGKMKHAWGILAGNPVEKKYYRPIHTSEDNIKMYLREKQGVRLWIGFVWLWIESSGELL